MLCLGFFFRIKIEYMKKLVLIGLGIVLFQIYACKGSLADRPTNEILRDTVLFQNPTTISFQDTLLDLGEVKEGTKVDFKFVFTNTGKYALLLHSVKPSCGCTVADYPKYPISTGKSDTIKGSFNSEGRLGSHEKHIEVVSNSERKVNTLIFKIKVK
jgi:hypothetical protein